MYIGKLANHVSIFLVEFHFNCNKRLLQPCNKVVTVLKGCYKFVTTLQPVTRMLQHCNFYIGGPRLVLEIAIVFGMCAYSVFVCVCVYVCVCVCLSTPRLLMTTQAKLVVRFPFQDIEIMICHYSLFIFTKCILNQVCTGRPVHAWFLKIVSV